jgi:sulfur-carrier protein
MAVTVLLPGVLRADAGGASRLRVETAGTLRAVLDEIGRRWPRLERRIRDEQGVVRRFVNVYVDGEDCRLADGLDTAVADGAEVRVLPSVAGGAGTCRETAKGVSVPGRHRRDQRPGLRRRSMRRSGETRDDRYA